MSLVVKCFHKINLDLFYESFKHFFLESDDRNMPKALLYDSVELSCISGLAIVVNKLEAL